MYWLTYSKDYLLTHYDLPGVLKVVAGRKVLHVQYFVHLSKNKEITVISTKLIFAGDTFITVQCESDGESLRIGQDVFEEVDLGDAGQLKTIDLNGFDPASLRGCIGKIMESMTIETQHRMPKALSLNCSGQAVFFSNVGDELNFDETRFRKMIMDENWGALTRISVQSTKSDGTDH